MLDLAPGAALLEGWDHQGRWFLPSPLETRTLAWSDAAHWKELFRELEEDGGLWVGYIAYEAMACEEGVAPRGDAPPEPAMFFAKHAPWSAAAEPPLCDRVPERWLRHRTPMDSLANGAHARAVETIREAIRDGDVYQVNLTRAFTIEGRHDAAALYRALTGSAPPRSSAFLRLPDDCAIASASPEVLLRFDRVKEMAETRPIKGTVRRRGEDASEIASLLASEKDAAEHLMIVDVARNDLGKVATPGSVAVTEYRAVRTLEFVHHLESTVRAATPGCSAADVLAALAPAASITGAPKRAAVRIIRELEPVPRGVYCGAIGFIAPDRVELSVAIRTAVVTPHAVRYHAGGGIVWESDAAAEDEESFAKAEAFLRYAGVER